MKIKVNCPAKINLTLEVVNKRDDEFHNIKSIMHTISLFDYLTIEAQKSTVSDIQLSGNSSEIPYNEKNLVYKACEAFLQKSGINAEIDIYIEKHIPVSAGLAGGSTDAAGAIWGLNEIFDHPLTKDEIHNLCAMLGSDLNVCLEGGCILAQGRGEIIKKLDMEINYPITLIKPKKLGISAKEAYTKYASLKHKPQNNMTEKMIDTINKQADIKPFLYNDLEYAVFNRLTDELLKISPCKFYGNNMEEKGNICIAGHNYNDDRFFGKIDELELKDKIALYDLQGEKYEYIVFDIFETDENDTSVLENTKNYELTLVTCNNSNKKRVIVKAYRKEF